MTLSQSHDAGDYILLDSSQKNVDSVTSESQKVWYFAVIVGRVPGVYDSRQVQSFILVYYSPDFHAISDNWRVHVDDTPRAWYQRFSLRADAEVFYNASLATGSVQHVFFPGTRYLVTFPEDLSSIPGLDRRSHSISLHQTR